MEYFDFADAVYEFFDAQGGAQGIMERAAINQELSRARDAFRKEKDGRQRAELWKKISGLVKKDLEIKKGYALRHIRRD